MQNVFWQNFTEIYVYIFGVELPFFLTLCMNLHYIMLIHTQGLMNWIETAEY
jgi:hypothetical protein